MSSLCCNIAKFKNPLSDVFGTHSETALWTLRFYILRHLAEYVSEVLALVWLDGSVFEPFSSTLKGAYWPSSKRYHSGMAETFRVIRSRAAMKNEISAVASDSDRKLKWRIGKENLQDLSIFVQCGSDATACATYWIKYASVLSRKPTASGASGICESGVHNGVACSDGRGLSEWWELY